MNNFQRYPLLLCCIGKFVALFTFGLRHKQQLSAIVEKSVLASEPRVRDFHRSDRTSWRVKGKVDFGAASYSSALVYIQCFEVSTPQLTC